MILVDNLNLLKKSFPEVLGFMRQLEEGGQLERFPIVESKAGLPTIQVEHENKTNYLHSKYDPYKEAAQWIDNKEQELEGYNHIFVYGIGFGYHIEELMERFPEAEFTLYEPDGNLFYNFLSSRNMNKLSVKRVKHLFVEYVPGTMEVYLRHFVQHLQGQAYLFIHPVYERLFYERTKQFIASFKNKVYDYTVSIAVNTRYERLWTINSLGNFIKVLETPSVFHLDEALFQKKPVVMVAAGPSLQEEFDNLRYIKEHKLAYIVAVGSANKALLANGILPDGMTTYDPSELNVKVFQEFVEQEIDTVPLIFGSSVNHRTLPDFKGPLLHMITSQDTVSSYFLEKEHIIDNDQIINDAPTIAVVTLELLYKLGCSPTILVGQNFGFRGNQIYSKGIKYDHLSSELSDFPMLELVDVESTEGGTIKTIKTFIAGRQQMEEYIKKFAGMEIINATKGGAKIEGTTFQDLADIIHTRLKEPVVVSDWHKQVARCYDRNEIKRKAELLQKHFKELPETIDEITKCIKKMNTLVRYNEHNQLARAFIKLDGLMKDMFKNLFFENIIKPMIRNEFELLEKEASKLRFQSNVVEKAKRIVSTFGDFTYKTQDTLLSIAVVYGHLHQLIMLAGADGEPAEFMKPNT